MNYKNAKSIVKTNFMIATFDAMQYDWFREDHSICEAILEAAILKKIEAMSPDIIEGVAIAIVDGDEIGYDIESEEFYFVD